MRVENVDAALYSRATGRSSEEWLIEQGAGRMQSGTGHQHTAGDLLEFSRSGDGSKRKIHGANFGRVFRLEGKHGAVGRRAQIRRGGEGGRSEELIRSTGTPDSDGTAGSCAKGNKNVVARGGALNERGAGEAGNLG